MKKLSMMLVLAAGISLLPVVAYASPINNVEIAYSLNGGALTTFASGTGSALGTINVGGWNIQGDVVSSNAPSTYPQALSFSNVSAACTGGNCQSLQLYASSTGFTGTAQLQEGFTYNSAAQAGASASQVAFWDGGNGFFGTANSFGPALTLNGSPASGTSALGGTPSGTYSLTIEQAFSVPNSAYTYNTTGSVNAVPEPASLALLGTGLLGLGLVFKRRLHAGGNELA